MNDTEHDTGNEEVSSGRDLDDTTVLIVVIMWINWRLASPD